MYFLVTKGAQLDSHSVGFHSNSGSGERRFWLCKSGVKNPPGFPADVCLVWIQVDVSENMGTPKSSILIGFSSINHPFWGIPIFWKHPSRRKDLPFMVPRVFASFLLRLHLLKMVAGSWTHFWCYTLQYQHWSLFCIEVVWSQKTSTEMLLF